ncbi:flagellar basal body L-ring protein FlgH [Sphingomonas sp. BIUV-7]|uniref:Flagellar L-ring protein n=1 Tax=Sphingomonas natans TaxID=3063330 RepID=A0ABT8YFJ7_9SPHN|nr:flagellar basal body L-ring protein FlgH [Sphingomonas sp. BIUV-7]MDO6416549.1 flagellar basal body L-ring protein FlgH [Sphingomonas sp. BIUV-7]
MRITFAILAGLAAGAAILALPSPADAGLFGLAKAKDKPSYAPSYSPPAAAPVADGAIFHAAFGYAPLTSGTRAAMVGDVVTILLVEKTQALKSNSANTDRSGSISLTPPVTGPLDFIKGTDIGTSGGGKFDGKGNAAQSNSLNGEISVTIAQVYPNGTMLIRGEKQLTLNRGDEQIQISGIIRPNDISFDNRVLSTRVADARITYTGKGEIARASSQGWLGRFFSRVSPF